MNNSIHPTTTLPTLISNSKQLREVIGSPNGRLACTTIENGYEDVIYCDELQLRDQTLIFINPTNDMEGHSSLIA